MAQFLQLPNLRVSNDRGFIKTFVSSCWRLLLRSLQLPFPRLLRASKPMKTRTPRQPNSRPGLIGVSTATLRVKHAGAWGQQVEAVLVRPAVDLSLAKAVTDTHSMAAGTGYCVSITSPTAPARWWRRSMVDQLLVLISLTQVVIWSATRMKDVEQAIAGFEQFVFTT